MSLLPLQFGYKVGHCFVNRSHHRGFLQIVFWTRSSDWYLVPMPKHHVAWHSFTNTVAKNHEEVQKYFPCLGGNLGLSSGKLMLCWCAMKFISTSGLEKLRARSSWCTFTQKLLNVYEKCSHKRIYFESPLISKILDRLFTEMFYYCFIESFFVVHL